MKPVLRVRVSDLTFRFSAPATEFELIVPRLELRGGEFIAIYGPNGSGKTTLIRLLMHAANAQSGRVDWARGETTFLPVPGKDVVLTNAAGPFPHLTVSENLALASQVARNHTGPVDYAQVAEQWGLSEFTNRLPHQLSAGQAQRVVLARALLIGADAYLLDEVESAQSQQWAWRIGSELGALARAGRLVVVISHDPVWVAEHATRVIEIGTSQTHRSGTAPSSILYDGAVQEWPKLLELQAKRAAEVTRS